MSKIIHIEKIERKLINTDCDKCEKNNTLYDIGSFFICKKCIIGYNDKILKQKNTLK